MMKNENGRSMVEMLGVLAIIGVLSIGGIAGYTMAMNKYKANEVIAKVSQCAILARSGNAGEGIATNTKTCKDLGVEGLDETNKITVSGTTYTIPTGIASTDTGVCDAFKSITGASACTSLSFS